MKDRLEQLAALHHDIMDALDAGDIERVEHLAQLRQELLIALQEAFSLSTDSEKQEHKNALRTLQGEERILLERCIALRDELHQQLAAGHRRMTVAEQTNQQQQLLDYQA